MVGETNSVVKYVMHKLNLKDLEGSEKAELCILNRRQLWSSPGRMGYSKLQMTGVEESS